MSSTSVQAPSRRRRALRARRGVAAEGGSVTAETAVLLPALVVVLVMLLWVLSVAAAQIRCVDASRVASRGLARGEDPGVVRAVAAAAAPRDARIEMLVADNTVTVTVTAAISPPGALGGDLTTVTVGSSATAMRERGGSP